MHAVPPEAQVPNSSEILAGLTQIANEAFTCAVAWHIVLAAILIAVLAGWQPERRLVAIGLSTPLASVSAFAWAYGNPFNGSVFALLTVVLAVLAMRSPPGRVRWGGAWARTLGMVMIAFAWVYPHFLESRPAHAYLYGAPMGLIPCPTLSLVIGMALIAGGPAKRTWSAVLGGAGIFYAVFGAARLGVWLDLVLLAGALGLVAQVAAMRTRHLAPRAA
jgi:hypothetical protein